MLRWINSGFKIPILAPTIKYLVLAMLVSSNTWASEEFFKQYPKACRANSTSLTLTKDSSPLVAVLKCLDAKDKEMPHASLEKLVIVGFTKFILIRKINTNFSRSRIPFSATNLKLAQKKTLLS